MTLELLFIHSLTTTTTTTPAAAIQKPAQISCGYKIYCCTHLERKPYERTIYLHVWHLLSIKSKFVRNTTRHQQPDWTEHKDTNSVYCEYKTRTANHIGKFQLVTTATNNFNKARCLKYTEYREKEVASTRMKCIIYTWPMYVDALYQYSGP